MKIKNKDKTAYWFTVVSSVFLLLSWTNGFASFSRIEKTILNLTGLSFLKDLFIPILVIASLGAFAVLFGAFLIKKKKRFSARMFILFGSGAGLIGFLFNLIVAFNVSDFSIYSYLSFSSLGIILAILAQVFLKKK